MLLTISTTHKPASDLGYLLHKNPERLQSFDMAFGKVHVWYPEASDKKCTAALLIDMDPIGLVRGKRGEGRTLDQYVNDRPYVASSYLSVSLAQVFGSALNGRSKERQDLADTPIPLTATVSVVASHGGESLIRRLFEPLGYMVETNGRPLDGCFPEWGESPYFDLTISATVRLTDLLTHLYVLVPVLDTQKHYAFGDDEVAKLVGRGEGWLSGHPERDLIVNRYLRRRRLLILEALAQLTQDDAPADDDTIPEPNDEPEAVASPRAATPAQSLHDQRLEAVFAELKASGARRVLDLGCGEGRLLRLLLAEAQFTQILGMDVAYRSLEIAGSRLHLNRLPERVRERISLIHGSLIYRDSRLAGFDAAAIVEVVEHLDPPRLAAFQRVVFEFARPRFVMLTTPNREYNVKFEGMPEGALRHADHRFEWTRSEFEAWASRIAEQHGYDVTFQPIGPVDDSLGAPSQMATFEMRAKS